MQFTPSNFIANLSYMGLGLLGIFVVIGIIILVTIALARSPTASPEKKPEIDS